MAWYDEAESAEPRRAGRTATGHAALLSFWLAATAPLTARAHGGEDHAEPAAPPAGGTIAGQRTAYGQTSAFELTLVFTPPADEQPVDVLVYVADYATNEPITGGRVELELTATPPVKVAAEPTGRPGEYHAIVAAAPGEYAVVATVQAGQRFDLVEVKPLDLSKAVAEAAPHEHALPTWIWIAGGLLAGALLLVAWRSVRGRRLRASAALLLLALPHPARAHGGEDHGEPPAAASPTGQGGALHVNKPSQFLLGIRTRPVAEQQIQQRIETIGWVVPRIDGHAEVYPPQAGRIVAAGERLPFLGDRVRAGQALVHIEQVLGAAESGQIQAENVRARAGIAEAEARRAQARRDLERLQALQGVVSQKEIEQAQLELSIAEKDLQRARGEAQVFGGSLRRITVTAPIDGVVAEAAATAGELVTPEKKLFTVVEPSTLWIEADVFAADAARLRTGGTAVIRVEGDEAVHTGTLFRLGLVVAPATRTVKAMVSVPNPGGTLRPGQFADVALDAGPAVPGLAVPDAAVIEEGGRRFVFVHTAPESFVRREVVLGPGDGQQWIVTTGLQKGERVVTAGTYTLRTAR